MISGSRAISIWFFVGVLLALYGSIIVGAGIYNLIFPPAQPVVLAWLHADLWWGGLLFLVGAFYCHHFAPAKQQSP